MIFKALLNSNADVNKADAYGRSPLTLAIINDQLEMAELIIKSEKAKHVYKPECSFGYTDLMLAASNGNSVIIELLLKAGADVDQVASGWSNETALVKAIKGKNLEAVKVLLNAKAKFENSIPQIGNRYRSATNN